MYYHSLAYDIRLHMSFFVLAWQARDGIVIYLQCDWSKNTETWTQWRKYDLTRAVCSFDTYCSGYDINYFLWLSGTKENSGNGNNWTRRPSSESPWRSNIIYGLCIMHLWSIHLSLSFKGFLNSFFHSWRPRPCSVPSLLVTAWTVLCTLPRWWARARLTPSRRPAGKVSVLFVSPHILH